MKIPPLAIVAGLLLSGCFATKGDVEQLQTQLVSLQTSTSRADAAQRAGLEQAIAQLGRVNDSLRAVGVRLARLQSDVQTDRYEVARQILQIQELTGQSQRRLQELRASVEERSGTSAPARAPGDTATAAPGPAQLFQGSLDQLRRGSTAVARSGFEELLARYPSSEDAPEALVYVGETYAAERNRAAADSVFALVVQRYPRSPKAATALYKRSLSLKAGGDVAGARAALQRVLRDYPSSDEAVLAREQLRTILR